MIFCLVVFLCLLFKTDFTWLFFVFIFFNNFFFFFSLPSSIFLMALPLQLAQMMQPADCLISVQTKKSECIHMIILYVVSLQLPFLRVVVFYLVAMMISTVMYGMSWNKNELVSLFFPSCNLERSLCVWIKQLILKILTATCFKDLLIVHVRWGDSVWLVNKNVSRPS